MRPSSRRICGGVITAVVVLCVSAVAFTAARQASAADAPAKSSAPTVTETVVYSFCSQPDHNTGGCLDGETPNGVIEGSDGNFYGTTGPFGNVSGGTIYKLTPSGTLTTLHTFCPEMDPNRGDCLDGDGPGGLIEGSDGNFYGTAGTGGANFESGGSTTGTAYMITPSGAFTTLYSFCAQVDPETKNCLDGEQPDGIIEGGDGNFYGTTFSGGLNSGGARPAGVVFKLTASGVLTTLYNFCSQQNRDTVTCLDGEEPSGLIEGSDGNFYGITSVGGQFGDSTISGGTVFQLTPSGTFNTLHSFCGEKDPSTGNCLDGDGPNALIEGSDGNFYGSTSGGGKYDDGTVFKLTPSGTLTTLYSFCSQGNANTNDCLDGKDPDAVIEGSDGNFYGTTGGGGKFGAYNSDGTVFELTPSGALTTLYSFCSEEEQNSTDCLDGAGPDALIRSKRRQLIWHHSCRGRVWRLWFWHFVQAGRIVPNVRSSKSENLARTALVRNNADRQYAPRVLRAAREFARKQRGPGRARELHDQRRRLFSGSDIHHVPAGADASAEPDVQGRRGFHAFGGQDLHRHS